MKLRPYQVSGKHEILKAWEIDDIIFYVLATGGGKTVQFVDIMKDFLIKGLRVMLIAHREELITQAWNTLYSQKIYAGIIKGATKTNYEFPCQVCSIQTIARRENLPHADVIIIDEAHHVTEKNSYGKILARYPNAKVLMVSATPYRLSGEGFNVVMPDKVTRLIVNCTLKTLILDGWLVPLDYYAASIPDLSNVDVDNKGDYVEAQVKKAMDLAPIVESYLEHCNGLQGICFAVNVAHSIELTGQYWRHGVPAEHLDAETPDNDYTDKAGNPQRGRKSILRDYRAGLIKVVCNVGILTEGTDFPNCEFVQLARPTKSLSMYLQMVGRGTRALPGVVDNPELFTSEQRRAAIALSAKPDCKILDNGGLWIEHGLPDSDFDWPEYFAGWRSQKKKKKELEEIEILLFEVEAEDGTRRKTSNVKECEGLKLIRITKEQIRKAVNIKSIKTFDALYAKFKRIKHMKKPGYNAVNEYLKDCDKNKILVIPEIWDYLHKRLVDDIDIRLKDQQHVFDLHKGGYPDTIIESTLNNIKAEGVSGRWLQSKKQEYFNVNEAQIISYIQEKVLV